MSEKKTLYQSIFCDLPSNVALFDENGKIFMVNRAWREFAQANGIADQKKCCVGANYLEVTRRAMRDGAEGAINAYEGLQKIIKGEERQFSMDYHLPIFSEQRWYELKALRISGKKQVIVFHTDITKRVQSIQLRDEYVAMIAHDLKTPIQSAVSATELLLRDGDKKGKSAERILTIQRNCRRMNAMVAELSEASYMNSGIFQSSGQEVVLQQIVSQAISSFPEVYQARTELVAPGEPLHVNVDPNRFMRVMENLLSNAFKFSYPDKSVRIAIRKVSDKVEIEVADWGIGIAAEDLPHIFERYYRGKIPQKREGLGLGLHISRMIVLSHYGTISVKSEVGKGSTFLITLPLAWK